MPEVQITVDEKDVSFELSQEEKWTGSLSGKHKYYELRMDAEAGPYARIEVTINFPNDLSTVREFANALLDQVATEEEKERVRRAKLWTDKSISEKGA